MLSASEVFSPASKTISREAHGHAREPREAFSETGTVETMPAAQPADRQVARHGLLGKLHHPQGMLWNIYRMVVGAGLITMLASGTAIFIKSRARTQKKPPL